jgi:hypothetical protein
MVITLMTGCCASVETDVVKILVTSYFEIVKVLVNRILLRSGTLYTLIKAKLNLLAVATLALIKVDTMCQNGVVQHV